MLTLLAAISGQSLVSLVIWLVVLALIFYIVWWALGQFNLPEPFNKIVRVLVVLVCAILLINVLLGLLDRSFIKF